MRWVRIYQPAHRLSNATTSPSHCFAMGPTLSPASAAEREFEQCVEMYESDRRRGDGEGLEDEWRTRGVHRRAIVYLSRSPSDHVLHSRFFLHGREWPASVAGAWLTIQLTVVSILFGFVVGTVCAVARVYGRPCCAGGRGLCRGDPQHAAAGADLPGLSSACASLGLKLAAITAAMVGAGRSTSAPTPPRSCAPASSRSRAAQIEAGRVPGAVARCRSTGTSCCCRRCERVYPALDQPVRAADAGLQRRLADLGRGTDGDGQLRAVATPSAPSRSISSWPWSISPCRCSMRAGLLGARPSCCSRAAAGWARRCELTASRRQSPHVPASPAHALDDRCCR